MCFRYDYGHLILNFIFVDICIETYIYLMEISLFAHLLHLLPVVNSALGFCNMLCPSAVMRSLKLISGGQQGLQHDPGVSAIRMSVKNYAVNLVFIELTKKSGKITTCDYFHGGSCE